MSSLRLQKHLRVFALVAATLILPALAYAGNQDGNSQGGGNQDGNSQGGNQRYTVPEGGPGIVLLTATIGAILLFSARRRSKQKTA